MAFSKLSIIKLSTLKGVVLWKDVIKISNVTFALARIIFTVETALWIALKLLAQTVIAPVAEVLKTKTYKKPTALA